MERAPQSKHVATVNQYRTGCLARYPTAATEPRFSEVRLDQPQQNEEDSEGKKNKRLAVRHGNVVSLPITTLGGNETHEGRAALPSGPSLEMPSCGSLARH